MATMIIENVPGVLHYGYVSSSLFHLHNFIITVKEVPLLVAY